MTLAEMNLVFIRLADEALFNGFQLGTVDLGTGAFQPIGPNTPEGGTGLAPGPNGFLLTLAFSGNLDSINAATGVTTLIGPTGLADCTTPASPCGPTSANTIAGLGGKTYATDFSNNLYSVNPLTGAATLIGPTGVPPLTFIPLASPNPDGSFNVYGGLCSVRTESCTQRSPPSQ